MSKQPPADYVPSDEPSITSLASSALANSTQSFGSRAHSSGAGQRKGSGDLQLPQDTAQLEAAGRGAAASGRGSPRPAQQQQQQQEGTSPRPPMGVAMAVAAAELAAAGEAAAPVGAAAGAAGAGHMLRPISRESRGRSGSDVSATLSVAAAMQAPVTAATATAPDTGAAPSPETPKVQRLHPSNTQSHGATSPREAFRTLQPWLVPYSRLHLGRSIGSGAFSTVSNGKRGRWKYGRPRVQCSRLVVIFVVLFCPHIHSLSLSLSLSPPPPLPTPP